MTSEPFSAFGYKPDPPKGVGDKPDRRFSDPDLGLRAHLPTRSPGDVDLSKHTTESRQLWAGSCVGNATADSLEVLNSLDGLPTVQLSRLFIYTLSRNLMDTDRDGKGDIDKDEGTYIRLAFDVVRKFGVCREDVPEAEGGWPYNFDKLFTLPSLRAMRAATGHRIHSYYRIDEVGDDRVEAIIKALRAHHPVVFGTPVDAAFLQLRGLGPVGPPQGATVGGHAMMICGYDRTKGFLIHNSWGIRWGSDGFAYLTEDYLKWGRTNDIWVPTKGTTFK